MTSPISLVLDVLRASGSSIRSTCTGYVAQCRAHEDHNPSLSISAGEDGRVLLKCFAGCETEAVVAAMGLKMSDIMPPRNSGHVTLPSLGAAPPMNASASPITVTDLAKDKFLPVEYLQSLGLENGPRGVIIRYPDANDSPTPRQRLRKALTAKEGSLWLPGKAAIVPYGLDRLDAGQKKGFLVIVEGESDCWTLWYYGFPALGLPGASMANKIHSEYLEGINTVYIFHEPDNGGNIFSRGVVSRLVKVGYTGEVREVSPPAGIKDPNDWHKTDPQNFQARFREALENTEPSAIQGVSDDGGKDIVFLDRRDPTKNARIILESAFLHGTERTLYHHQGAFHKWTGTHYPEAEMAGIRAKLYSFLEKAHCHGKKLPEPFRPNRATVGDTLDALQAHAHLSSAVTPPAWIGEESEIPPVEIISCQNGLLHLPSGKLLPHTPRFFTHNALPFDFCPDNGPPAAWHQFLNDLWDDDIQSRDALQEMFGYFLTHDTRQQKIFLVVGPKRSGKGTIARVLTALLGASNVCAPTLASLGTNFGLSSLFGKQAAIVADARLGGRADQQAIAERLLSISGEDGIDIDRKYLPLLSGVRLATRFLILSNELPKITDASGALASRFIVLMLTQSFYGKEDHGLADRLMGELPQILNWAIEGWRRLRDRGYFVQPSAAEEAVRELEDLGSPIAAFVRERCETGLGHEVECQRLYYAWKTWCEEYGRDHVCTLHTFGRDLRAAVPMLRTTQHRGQDARKRFYLGIRLL